MRKAWFLWRFALVVLVSACLQAGGGAAAGAVPVSQGGEAAAAPHCADGAQGHAVTGRAKAACGAADCPDNGCTAALCLAGCTQAGIIPPVDGPVKAGLFAAKSPAYAPYAPPRGDGPPLWLRPPQTA